MEVSVRIHNINVEEKIMTLCVNYMNGYPVNFLYHVKSADCENFVKNQSFNIHITQCLSELTVKNVNFFMIQLNNFFSTKPLQVDSAQVTNIIRKTAA